MDITDALQDVKFLSEKITAVRTLLARVEVLPSLFEDQRLSFSLLQRLVLSLMVEGWAEASSATGQGSSCSSTISRVKAQLVHIAENYDSNDKKEKGIAQECVVGAGQYTRHSFPVTSLPPAELIQLLPALMSACQSAKAHYEEGLRLLYSKLNTVMSNALGSKHNALEAVRATWEAMLDGKELMNANSSFLFAKGCHFFQKKTQSDALQGYLSEPSTSKLIYVCLSRCSLTDSVLESAMPLLSALPFIQVVDVSSNAFTIEGLSIVLREIKATGVEETSPHHPVKFPSLEYFAVHDNPLAIDGERLETQIEEILAARRQGGKIRHRVIQGGREEVCGALGSPSADATSSEGTPMHGVPKSREGAPFRVLVLDGVGMEAAVVLKGWSTVMPLLCDHSTCVRSVEGRQEQGGALRYLYSSLDLGLIGASSFNAVTAAAIVAGIPPPRIEVFFKRVATNVFGEYAWGRSRPKSAVGNEEGESEGALSGLAQGGYAVSGGLLAACRWARRWYTGGHYYNWEALKAALTELFGSEDLNATLAIFAKKYTSAPRLVLMVRGAGHGGLRVFRSHLDRNSENGALSGHLDAGNPETTTLGEALEACCAIPGYFTPRQTSMGVAYVDSMASPLCLSLEESLRLCPALSKIRLCVLSPERGRGGGAAKAGEGGFDFGREPLVDLLLERSEEAKVRAAAAANNGSIGPYFSSIDESSLPREHRHADRRRVETNRQRALVASLFANCTPEGGSALVCSRTYAYTADCGLTPIAKVTRGPTFSIVPLTDSSTCSPSTTVAIDECSPDVIDAIPVRSLTTEPFFML